MSDGDAGRSAAPAALSARVRRKLREAGWRGAARAAIGHLPDITRDIYRARLRPWLPTLHQPVLNGIRVARPRKLLDGIVPASWAPEPCPDDPLYESALVAALKRHVRAGDSVVVIGGGLGVTAITAARLVGRGGTVICFEGAREKVADVEQAVRLNAVAAAVRVEHVIVARGIAVWGDASGARVLAPAELPPCDVLEMDCEGAELDILDGLRIRPRAILVETHGVYGAPTEEVRARLDRLGYDVEDAGVAETGARRQCIENDVRVLIGSARPSSG